MDAQAERPAEPDIVHAVDQPAYSEDGVDLTLIRWMLSLTPLERLLTLQSYAESIQRVRDANPHL